MTHAHHALSTLTLIALLGPPASGKGTLARALAEATGGVIVGTGELLRAAAGEDPALATHLAAGGMVDDAVIAGLVTGALETHAAAGTVVILDGVPRRAAQVALITGSPQGQARAAALIVLHAERDVLLTRTLARDHGRPEDSEAGLSVRLGHHDAELPGILDAAAELPTVTVDAAAPAAEVAHAALAGLAALAAPDLRATPPYHLLRTALDGPLDPGGATPPGSVWTILTDGEEHESGWAVGRAGSAADALELINRHAALMLTGPLTADEIFPLGYALPGSALESVADALDSGILILNVRDGHGTIVYRVTISTPLT